MQLIKGLQECDHYIGKNGNCDKYIKQPAYVVAFVSNLDYAEYFLFKIVIFYFSFNDYLLPVYK